PTTRPPRPARPRWSPEGSPIDSTRPTRPTRPPWTPEGSPIDSTRPTRPPWTPEGSPINSDCDRPARAGPRGLLSIASVPIFIIRHLLPIADMMPAMKRILIIGATGTVGRNVISQLIDANVRLRGLTRNPDSANLPAGVETIPGDLAMPDSLDRSLDNVDAVFLVWTAPPAACAPALARIAKHVPKVVFLSSPHQTEHPFFRQPNPV